MEELKEKAGRWDRIVMNNLENIPMAVLVFWLGTWTPNNHLGGNALFALFTLLRIIHTVLYACGVLYARTAVYLLSIIFVLGAGINAMAGVHKIDTVEEKMKELIENESR